MKQIYIFLISIIFFAFTNVDIAPNPMEAKGIYPTKECKIRMESEIVVVDLHVDHSVVNCTFEMVNYGGDTTLPVGFPVMDFSYWSEGGYTEMDKSFFTLTVDGSQLDKRNIKVHADVEDLYQRYMAVYAVERELERKRDSIYKSFNIKSKKNRIVFPKGSDTYAFHDAISSLLSWRDTQPNLSGKLLMEFNDKVREGKYPWYVWDVKFKENERKTIQVSYKLPAGMSYGAHHRYFSYLLNTGAGWYKSIGRAEIILKLNNISLSKIDSIAPKGYVIDKKANSVNWIFNNIEPVKTDDIYLQYYVPKERKSFNKRYNQKK